MIQKKQSHTPAENHGPKVSSTIYGLRPVIEAIDGDTQIDKVLIQNGLAGPLAGELKGRIRDNNIPFQFVPIEKLNRMTKGNHQGVVALISPIEYKHALDLIPQLMEGEKAPMVLLLDHVTDVRNFGAIVRTAECTGVDAVIIPDHGSAQVSDDAVKTSSGALLRMPICRESNLKTVLNLAKQCGMQIVAATEKGATDYLEVDYTKPTLLVMGAEETGISPEILKMADSRAKLPILGQVQSLNVSVAAAVFMYEVLRQRR
ncbi:MAG: 23S rRNA (guanosine(2251)-2'-O)-methyltransferase RlmB [Bacteroidales bacterium]|nr:23S rRNA (guanosine(2251)-2'-O)-methyltransferase RlmB [Bacteroidales bacterium]